MTILVKKNPRLRQQFAVGVLPWLSSERDIIDNIDGGLSASVMRIFDGRNIFEFNVSAAIIWLFLDEPISIKVIFDEIISKYPTFGELLSRDIQPFFERCAVDSLVHFDNLSSRDEKLGMVGY